jgi:glycosyltransferase involved in cell wall biosynthesis
MTNGVGIADEVASNGAGIIVPANSRALASAIERILSEPELAARLSHRGVSLVRSRYQSDAVAAQVMQLYAEIGGRA